MILTRSQSLSNYRVGAFTHDEHSALRISYDYRHAFAVRIEFYHVQKFVLNLLACPDQVDYYVVVDVSIIESEP